MCVGLVTKELLNDVIIPTVHTGPKVILSLHNFALRAGSFLFPYKRSTQANLWAVVLNESHYLSMVAQQGNTVARDSHREFLDVKLM